MIRIQHASCQSIKPFKSSEEYLYAMKEDLAEWLKDLYNIDIDVYNILEELQTGTVLCWHANEVTRVAEDFKKKFGMKPRVPLPTSGVTFVDSAEPGTFLARDNISNFINWCRNQMGVKDVLMFETNDLVLRKNEKNFVLCLLEVARRASRFGMSAPVLIQLEEEIEEEMQEKLVEPPQKAQPKRQISNTLNLDQMIQQLICRCTCPTQFPMVKVSDGKYKVGDSSTLIFVRILRNHVMVRVGGGWDTLEHYLDKHDPCRCTALIHCLTPVPATPVHHKIRGRLTPCPDGPGPVQQPSTLLLSRHAETPLRPVPGTPSSPLPYRSTRASLSPSPEPGTRTPNMDRQSSRSPNPTAKSSIPVFSGPGLRDSLSVPSSGLRQRAFSQSPSRGLTRSPVSPDPHLWISRELKAPTPNKWQSTSTPALHRLQDESKDGTVLHSTRTGREATRSTPTHRLTSSLPRPVQRPPTPQPPRTCIFAQSWTKSQIASKLKQSLTSGAKENTGGSASQRQGGRGTPRPSTPICGNMNSHRSTTPTPVNLKTNNFHYNADNHRNPAESIQNVFRDPNNNKTSKMYKVENRLNEPDCRVYIKPSGKVDLQHPGVDSLLDNSFCSVPADDVYHKNVQQAASQPRLEYSRERLGMNAARSKPPPLRQKHDPVNTIYPHETSYNSAVAEHFKCTKRPENVCAHTHSCSSPNTQRDKTVSRSQNVDSSLDVEEPDLCGTSSWPSIGSCVKSKEPLLDLGNGVKDNIRQTTMATALNSVNPGTDSTNQDNPEEPRSTSVRPRRALKKPERIPSIYKLKYRPRGRPRHDHRPGKKPSRIPTPISYKASKPTEESDWSRMDKRDTLGHEAPTLTSHLSADEQRSGGMRIVSRQ